MGTDRRILTVLDSLFLEVGNAISADQQTSVILESSVITLDNIGIIGVDTVVGFTDGTALDIAAEDIDFIIVGNLQDDGDAYGSYSISVETPSPVLTSSDTSYSRDSYFFKSRPQYEDIGIDNIINVKDYGAKGDGVTDDTYAIGEALALGNLDTLAFFPAGS